MIDVLPGSISTANLRSSAACKKISRRLADAPEPNLGRRSPSPQAHDCRVVVLIEFIIAGSDVHGDELTVVLGPEYRPHLAVEYLDSDSGHFVWTTSRFGGSHDRSPSRS
jgi:hypothetical protein